MFATGEAAAAAREAGADVVGADDLAAEIEKGNIDFDVAIATPDLMPLVGRLGRVLGPAGPHAQPEDRHRHHRRGQGGQRLQGRQGRVPHHRPSNGVVQVPIGKASFPIDALEANFRAVLDELQRVKPAAAKGKYVKKITVSSTMGPGVRVDTNRIRPETTGRRPLTWRLPTNRACSS